MRDLTFSGALRDELMPMAWRWAMRASQFSGFYSDRSSERLKLYITDVCKIRAFRANNTFGSHV